MDFHNLKVVLGQLAQALPHIQDGVVELESSAKEVQKLKAQKLEAETAYRHAFAERAQIIEAIENLKKQHTELSRDNADRYAETVAATDKAIQEDKQAADKKIADLKAQVAKAESDAAQRIAKADTAANAAEARVKKAEAALAALKSA